MRYHMRPFNSGVPRFEYQKDKNSNNNNGGGGGGQSPRK